MRCREDILQQRMLFFNRVKKLGCDIKKLKRNLKSIC